MRLTRLEIAATVPSFVTATRYFHYAPACSRTIGPRGGIQQHYEVWRENGHLQIRNGSWRLPIKHGLYDYAAIEPCNVDLFHPEALCPCLQPPNESSPYTLPCADCGGRGRHEGPGHPYRFPKVS